MFMKKETEERNKSKREKERGKPAGGDYTAPENYLIFFSFPIRKN